MPAESAPQNPRFGRGPGTVLRMPWVVDTAGILSSPLSAKLNSKDLDTVIETIWIRFSSPRSSLTEFPHLKFKYHSNIKTNKQITNSVISKAKTQSKKYFFFCSEGKTIAPGCFLEPLSKNRLTQSVTCSHCSLL